MKKIGDLLLRREPCSEIVIGNTALARGMIEAGVEVVTSYPGSPTPEIAAAICSIPAEVRPLYFEYSTNEKVATELAFGASINGRLSVVFFKSVGLNVAADAFIQLPLLNTIGGMVIILGDDPGATSSQNEQDNRYYAMMAKVPVWEPAEPQEAYEMFLQAAEFSRQQKMPTIVRMTTHVCHAKRKVHFGRRPPDPEPKGALFDAANGPYIPITVKIAEMKRNLREKMARAQEHSQGSVFNKLLDNGNRKRGVISCGLPFLSIQEVILETENPPDVLKLAMPYPLPKERIIEFCRNHQEVKILEELDPVIETAVKALAYDAGLSTRIIGKVADEEFIGEYTTQKVRSILRDTWEDIQIPEVVIPEFETPAPSRAPQLCPGCGHRSAFHAIKKVLTDQEITVADIGCHTLGFMEPHSIGEVLVSMGHSNATGAGMALGGHGKRIITFLGDSTFFHSGFSGVVNAIANRHNITLIVMHNGTTAMTGHQDNPSTDELISIRAVLESLGVTFLREVDAYQQNELAQVLREALEHPEFSVIIARHPCMLKFTTKQRRKGIPIKTIADVDSAKCDRLHHCITDFACPSFHRQEDGTITVNPDLCIGDGSCLQTCPVEAISMEKRESGSSPKEDSRG